MVRSASMACSCCSIRARRSGSARTSALISLQSLCPLMAILLLYVALLGIRQVHTLSSLITIPTHEASCALIANQHNRLFANKKPRNWLPGLLAPRTGFEPVTSRLTAGRSTVELSGIIRSTNNGSIHQVGRYVNSFCLFSHNLCKFV